MPVPFYKRPAVPVFPYGDPLIVHNVRDQLRFVSCGERGYNREAISEFFNVYDVYVWILILGIVGILSISLWMHHGFTDLKIKARKLKLLGKLVFSLYRAFLEQGDPFPMFILTHARLRMMVSTFLLAAVVLSNAYKNTNVYNMISPKKPYPYEKSSELINDKFAIYAKTGYTIAHNSFRGNEVFTYNTSIIGWTKSNSVRLREDGCTKIELTGMSQLYVMDVVNRQQKWNHSGVATVQRLLNHSSFVIDYRKEFEDVVSSFNCSKQNKHIVLTDEFESEFHSRENAAIENALERCNKTAVIYTEYRAKQEAIRLHQRGEQHVFVGEEIYGELFMAYVLTGYVPPFVLSRIKGLQMSGIVKWQMDLLSRADFNETRFVTHIVQKPRMNGNVVVIFGVLAAGLGLSSLVIFCENLKRILKYVFEKTCQIILWMHGQWSRLKKLNMKSLLELIKHKCSRNQHPKKRLACRRKRKITNRK